MVKKWDLSVQYLTLEYVQSEYYRKLEAAQKALDVLLAPKLAYELAQAKVEEARTTKDRVKEVYERQKRVKVPGSDHFFDRWFADQPEPKPLSADEIERDDLMRVELGIEGSLSSSTKEQFGKVGDLYRKACRELSEAEGVLKRTPNKPDYQCSVSLYNADIAKAEAKLERAKGKFDRWVAHWRSRGAHWIMLSKSERLAKAQAYSFDEFPFDLHGETVATPLPCYTRDTVLGLVFGRMFGALCETRPFLAWVTLLNTGTLRLTPFTRAYPAWAELCVARAKVVEPEIDWDAIAVDWRSNDD